MHDYGVKYLQRLLRGMTVRAVSSTRSLKGEPKENEVILLKSFGAPRGLKGIKLYDPNYDIRLTIDKCSAVEATLPNVLNSRCGNTYMGMLWVTSAIICTYLGRPLEKMRCGDLVEGVKSNLLTSCTGIECMYHASSVPGGGDRSAQYMAWLWAQEFLDGVAKARDKFRKSKWVLWYLSVGDSILVAFECNGDNLLLIVPVQLGTKELPCVVGPGFTESLPLVAPTRVSEFLGFIARGRIDRLVSAVSSGYR